MLYCGILQGAVLAFWIFQSFNKSSYLTKGLTSIVVCDLDQLRIAHADVGDADDVAVHETPTSFRSA